MSGSVVLRFGQAGFDLYKELHLSRTNEIVHALGMPFVIWSIFMWLPALMNLETDGARMVNHLIYFGYLGYYSLFDQIGMLMSAVAYFPSFVASMANEYGSENRRWNLILGLSVMVCALVIQESVGHSVYERANSDLWQIPNSISIAPLFGARSLFASA